MMQCAECEHWIHAQCQGLTTDQYECLSELPEEIHYVCKRCCQDDDPRWFQELRAEMQAGYERVP